LSPVGGKFVEVNVLVGHAKVDSTTQILAADYYALKIVGGKKTN
jgi:hypothetical protein